MNEKTELTVQQSQHLVELGFDPNKASKQVALTIYEQEYSDKRHPVFTLSDILKALPSDLGECYLHIEANRRGWQMWYSFYFYTAEGKTLIDTAYNLLCWCLKNKYV